ncbi:MAG: hypothetical protein WDO73_16990 [Ignavibacteriota bacterium]
MRLSTKLCGAVAVTAAVGMLAAGAGILYLRTMGDELRIATESTAVKLDLVNATRARIWEAVASLHTANLYAGLDNQSEVDAGEKRRQAALKRVLEQIAEMRPLVDTIERSDLDRLERSLSEFAGVSADYIRVCREKQPDRLAELAPKVQAFTNSADEILTRLKNGQRALLKATRERSASLRSQSLFVNILMSCLLVAISVLSVIGVRNVSQTLTVAITELAEGARQIAGAAGQVSRSGQALAQGASEQAASPRKRHRRPLRRSALSPAATAKTREAPPI